MTTVQVNAKTTHLFQEHYIHHSPLSDSEDLLTRIHELEEESQKLLQLQQEANNTFQQSLSSQLNSSDISIDMKILIDSRSVHVGNVDYSVTYEMLEKHFHGCGAINRVTIPCNKFDGKPKGFAYIEFCDNESVKTALVLDDTILRGRKITVTLKRTNLPGISTTNRRPRGRGFSRGSRGFGRGTFRGSSFRSRGNSFGSMRGSRSFRGHFAPY